MATIRTAIQIQDGMSRAFQSMNTAMNVVLSSFESLQTASGNAIDTASIQMARQELMRAESAFNDIEREINQTAEAQRQFNSDIRNGQSDVNELVSKFRNLAITVGSLFAIGSVFKGGFDRLIGIDTANAKLQALGHNIQAVEVIMGNALNSVTGTSFRLEEAVNTAASAVAAGIKPGQQLEKYLSLTADAAAIAGTGMNEMGAIFNKVTTSGMIQAMELNQIADRGIPIFQMLADEMGVTAQEIRKLASEGRISSGIFLNAIDSGFGGAAQAMGTASFQATMDNIGASVGRIGANFINGSGDGQGFFDQVKPLMVDLLDTLKGFEAQAAKIGDVLGSVFNFMHENWSIIAPLISGATTALLIYASALIGVKTITMIASGWQAIMAARTTLLTGATFAQTAAQHGLNAAMMASPITWVIMAVIILITLFYAAIAAINHFAGTSLSATGLIAGAFAVLGAFIWNTVVGVINAVIQFLWTSFVEPWIGIIEWVLNVFNGGFNSFGDAVANLLGNIISWFLSLGKVVTNIIDAIFGTSWTAGLSNLQDSVLAWGKNETAITLERKAPVIDSRIEYGNAWDTGYEWGANLFSGDQTEQNGDSYEDLLSGIQGTATPLDDTAKNTAKMAKTMEASEEDLKYLRDMAERDVINRFTTAEVKVDFSSQNTINSDLDLDGIIDQFAEKLEEALDVAAEGA